MKNLRKLFEILDKWKYHYLLAGLLLVVTIAFRSLEPKVLQIAVDKVVVYFASSGTKIVEPGDGVTAFLYSFLPELKMGNLHMILLGLGLMYMTLALARGGFSFLSGVISASSTEKAIKRLRDRLFKHLQRLPMAFHSKNTTGELIQRCTGDVETVSKFANMQVVEALRMSAIFCFAFGMMAMIDLTYALIAISVIPIILVGSFFFFRKEGEVWAQHEKEQDKLTAMVQENLSGIRVVKAFAKERYEIEKFTKQNYEKRKWGIKLVKLHSKFWPSSDFFVHVQIALSIFAGGYFVLKNRISIGEYVAFYSYAVTVTWPMRRLAQLVSEMGMTSVAIKRIYEILNSPVEDNSGFDDESVELSGEIEFENVSFNYDEGEKHRVLDGVSFKVLPGEKIALLGPTGAGKSTIISLLMRFYEPDKGVIKIDGRNIKEYSPAYLRKKIGVVLQRPFLFSTTIKENIAYAEPETELEDIVESAKIASIHRIIEDVFPKSYDTVIGEKGVTLSGGQKQRVTIARTLLKAPDILVLDDSTSSVDTETEFEIQKALRPVTKHKTIFVIAHRITSVQDSDRIIVLEKGKVIEMGSHNELIKNNGFYKKIFDIQISIEDEINRDIDGSAISKRQRTINKTNVIG
jgi:ATP-binding cassette subfamily B protein